MTARTTIRNRGISIAAAAVTAALIAPAVQPVSSPLLPAAHAQEAGDAPAQGGENAPAAPSLEDQPKIDSHGNPVIWADGVANGYVSSVSNMHLKDYVLSGRAWEINNVGLITGTGLPAVPAGTTIYMQWIDTDGSVSPYYAAKIHNAFRGAQGGEGTFAFDMRQPWVDTNGTQHQWSAEKGKSFRLWIPAYERDGVKYNMLRQADPFFPGAFVGNHSEGNGSTHYLDKNKQFLRVLMAQVPNVELMTRPRDEWEDGTITKGNEHVVLTGIRRERDYKDTVSGTVWNETGTRFDRTGNMSTGPNFTRKSGDRLHEGATVVFSKMTPEGYQKYDAAVNSLPEEQRTAAAVKFLKENPDAIAFTRYSKTNENGQFTIQLPSGAIPDGLRTTDAGFKDFRDIWMGVIDSNGDIVTSYSPWMVPQFHSPRAFVTMRPRDPGRNPINAPVVNSPETKGRNLKSVAFALLPGYDVNLRIINFNTTDKPASPGDVAELELTGKLPPLNSWIEWRDPQGKVLKGGAKGENLKDIDCLIVNGDMGDCRTFEVPKDAKAGTIYTAYLVNGTPGFDEQGRPRHNDIAADSFIVASMQNAEFDPAYEETRVKQGEEATIDAPKDKGGKELPKGTKFTAPEDVTEKIQGPSGPVDAFPGDLKINEDGSIKVKPNDDAPLGEYKVPVLVTYPDGSKETIYAPITVVQGDKPFTPPEDNDTPGIADEITPSWENQKTPAGKPVTSPNVGEEIPADSKVEASSDKGWKTEVNGTDITVTPPADAKTGDKSTIWVKVTYPDDSVDIEKFTVTVQNPDDKGTQADQTTPDWKNAETKPNEPVDVPNTGDKLPEGSKVEAPSDIDGWKIETGPEGKPFDTVRVTPPADAKPGDKIEVPVKVTYPDGSVDNETFTVTVKGDYEVKYNDAKGQPGTKITATPESLKHDLPASTRYAQGPDKDDKGVWKIEAPNEKTGAIDATVSMEDLAKKYQQRWGDVCEPGGLNTKEVTEFVKDLMEATSSANVTFTAEEKQDNVPAKFILTDKDGNNLADNNDWDGDGVDNQTEIENCSNPLDPNDKPKDPDAGDKNPDWDDTTTEPDKPVDLPNKGGPVKPGTTVETNGPGTAELKPNGTITVTPEGAKPGDEIVVTVKDKDDKVIDEVTVKITEPSKTIADQTDPDWKDKETTPGTPVEVPNEGDKLPEGSKVEVPEGADGWKVEVGSDGSTIVVTPPADAAPGAKLDVPVKVTYPDNSVDTDDFTVTVKDPNAGEKNPDWDDTTTEPDKPVDLPNKGGPVKPGTTVETDGPGTAELKPDGTITVTPGDGAKPGDKIKVIVKDPNGKVIDEVTVKITDPNAGEKNPDWDDTTTEPDKPVDLPNKGGPVKPGTTVETDGPGTAELKPDGTITVTPGDGAKPGDKIKVIVKDPNGKVIDEVTVKITEPSKTIADQTDPDWKDKETNPGEPVNVPNEGDQLPQGSKVEVSGGKNGWNIKVDGDGSTIVVTPPASAKPGDKITVPVKVTYPDNSVDTDDFTVTVKDPNAGVKNPDWNDGKTEPTKPVDLPNVGGPVKDGTTVETEGPGTAKLNPNDSITVTPGDDAKPGDTIKVTVKDKDGKVIDTVKVTITKPGSSTPGASSLTEDERNRCIAVSVGFGLPLAALVPLGLAMRMNIPGLSPVVDQLSIQIQRVNNDLQNSLGVFNPEAARAAQQLDANLRAFGLDLVSLGAGLAAVVAGIAAIAAVASACTPGDGSSVGTIEGQVGSTPAGSAKQSSERGSSVKVTEE